MPAASWATRRLPEGDVDLGADYYERRRDRERETRRLVRQLEDLGHTVSLTPTAA